MEQTKLDKTSDCAGNLHVNKNCKHHGKTKTGLSPEILDSSSNQKQNSKDSFLIVVALRVLLGIARAIRGQIGNTKLAGCNCRSPERKILPSSFVCKVRH